MIKKIVVLILVLFSYVVGIAQPVTARSSSVVTVMDSRFFAQYNFRPPVFPDTTAANVQKGLDSCGALIFTYDYNGYWYRACSPKRWVKVGITTGGDTAYVSSRQLTPNTFVLCRGDGRCDTISIATQGVTRLVSGSAVWTSGLNYDVTNCVYYILGTLYNSLATTVTLDPADPTNPRIDVIYLDTLGNVGVITGTPSPDPIKPVVNPLSQIELTHVYLNAGSTSPPNVYNRLVYNEGVGVPTEWNIPVASETIDYYYTPNPYVGSVSAYNSQSGIGNDYDFINNTSVNADTISLLTMHIRANGTMTDVGKGLFYVLLYKADNPVSNYILITDGTYGFNQSLLNQYQLVSIPMTDFYFDNPLDKTFDEIKIIVGADIVNGVQFDYINLQSGSAVPPVTSNYWSLSGNDVSSVTSPKLGTTSNNSLSIVTNDIERINISDTGLVKITNLQTNTSQDTTTYKPVGVNSAGEITKMDSWAGSSQTPNLQQVTDAGNTTITPINITSNIDNSIGQPYKLHISDVNGAQTDSANIDFYSNYNTQGSAISFTKGTLQTNIGSDIGLDIYNGNYTTSVKDAGISNAYSFQTATFDYSKIHFDSSFTSAIDIKPLYNINQIHDLYTPLLTPTQLTDTIATLRDIRAGGGGSGGTTPTLQQVTDAGNSTTTPISISKNQYLNDSTILHLANVNSFNNDSSTVDFISSNLPSSKFSRILVNPINSSFSPLGIDIFAGFRANGTGSYIKIGKLDSLYTQMSYNSVQVDDINANGVRYNSKLQSDRISFINVPNNKYVDLVALPQSLYELVAHEIYTPLTIPTQGVDTLATLRDIRAGGGGSGSGTVTSISQGYGISNSPNPITTTGTISVDTATLSGKYLRIVDTTNKWVSSVTKINDSTIRVVKDGTTNDLTFATATNATRLITQVWNSTGATITRGSVIYINGAHSSVLPSIALAKANAESTSAFTYGLVVNDIPDNSEGTVIQNGAITNLNLPTTSYTDGQTLYLSPTIAGGYTTTKPLAPNHYVAIGTITRAHPVFGTIQVAIRNGFQLDEMSDVQIPAVPDDSTLLQFSRVDSLWHAVSPTNAIGSRYIKPSDTATMLSPYLRKIDTASLSSRINTKANLSQSQYSFLANNTNATANMTSQTFNDQTSQTYSGTITWGTGAPSGTTNHSYRWTQVGKMVNLNIILIYGTAATVNQTTVIMSLPTGVPYPIVPSGMSATNGDMLYFGTGNFYSTINTVPTTSGFVAIRGNASGGYELVVTRAASAANIRYVNASVTYWTN